MCKQRGNLPVTLSRSVTVGTVAGEGNVARSLVDVTIQHQFVSQFPHRALVHRRIAYVGQHRLYQPVHHLFAVALQFVFYVSIQCHHGVWVTARFNRLKPLIVYAHCLVEFPLALSLLLTTQETCLVGSRQCFQHQLLVVVGLALVHILHMLQSRVVSQFAIHIVVGLIVYSQRQRVDSCRTDRVKDIERFVVHTYIRTPDSQLRAALNRCRSIAKSIGQSYTLTKKVYRRIADKRAIKLVQLVVSLVPGPSLTLQTQRPAHLANLLFVRSHVVARMLNSIVYLSAIIIYILYPISPHHASQCS